MTRVGCGVLDHVPTSLNMIGIGSSKSDSGTKAQLFKLKNKGHFQIWTRETLQQYGFEPRSAAYYVVLHFDPAKPIALKYHPNLKEDKNTFRAKIRPLSDFVGIK